MGLSHPTKYKDSEGNENHLSIVLGHISNKLTDESKDIDLTASIGIEAKIVLVGASNDLIIGNKKHGADSESIDEGVEKPKIVIEEVHNNNYDITVTHHDGVSTSALSANVATENGKV